MGQVERQNERSEFCNVPEERGHAITHGWRG